MNVNQKGTIGLIKVIDDLYHQGLQCYLPFDDYSPVDLIAIDKNGFTYRIQVKYKSSDTTLATRSIVNGQPIQIDRSLLDGWAVYLAEHDKVIYIPIEFMKDRKTHRVAHNFDYGSIW